MKTIYAFFLIISFAINIAYGSSNLNFTDDEYNHAKEQFYIQADEIASRDTKALLLQKQFEEKIEVLGKQRIDLEARVAQDIQIRDSYKSKQRTAQADADKAQAASDRAAATIEEYENKIKELRADEKKCTGISVFDFFLDWFCSDLKKTIGYKNAYYENEINNYAKQRAIEEEDFQKYRYQLGDLKRNITQYDATINAAQKNLEQHGAETKRISSKYQKVQENIVEFNTVFIEFRFLNDNIESAEYINNPKALYPLFIKTSEAYTKNINKYDRFLNQYSADLIF